MSTEGKSEVKIKPIEGQVAMTLDDFMGAWRFMPQTKRSIALVLTVVLLVPTIHWIISLRTGEGGGALYGVGALIALCAVAFGIWRGRLRWARGALVTLQAQEGILFRFDDYGFFFKAPGREARFAWGTMYRYIEAGPSFLVYTGPLSLVVIPKRAFAPEDERQLDALLRERIRSRPLAGTAPVGRLVVLWLVLVIAFLAIWQLLNKP